MNALSAKAIAGLAEGRVRPTIAPVRRYNVESATRPGVRHAVFVGPHTAYCTCEHTGPKRTTHHDAVVAREWATPEEVALMDEAIELAKARDRAAGEDVFARL